MKMLRSRIAFFCISVLLASFCSAETITVTADGEPISPDTYTVPFTGANDLVKNGDGTFTLTGSNTYTGSTTINAGTLKLTGGYRMLRGTTGITIASGATLELASANPLGYGTDKPVPITVNGGTITFTSNGNNANLGDVTLNGGSIQSTVTGSSFGTFLLAGTITVTEDAEIVSTDKVLIRRPVNRSPGSAKAFIINSGKTLTIDAPLNFADNNTGDSVMDISGGGTLLLTKAASTGGMGGLAGTTIVVDGASTATGTNTTFDIAVNNVFGTSEPVRHATDKTKNFTVQIKNDGVLNVSAPGHINLGNLVLDGGKITALKADGTANPGSAYGNILLCGTTTVTKDSEISANIFVRGGNNSNGAGEITVDPGVTLTMSGKMSFNSGANENGTIVISGGGTVLVPTGAGQAGGENPASTITVTGEKVTVTDPDTQEQSEVIRATTLQYGNGGASGAWFGPVILKDYAVLLTNRSSINDYMHTLSASNGTMVQNDGTAEIKYAGAVTVSRPETLEGAADFDLNFNANAADIRLREGALKGDGIVLKTGEKRLMIDGAHTDFTGELVLKEGVMNIKSGDALGTGTLTFAGGTLKRDGVAGNARVELKANINVAADTTSTVEVNTETLKFLGNMTGSGNLTKTGGTQLHFSGDNSGFSGTVTSTSNWLGFYFNPNDENKTESASAAARYVVNGSGMIFVPKTGTDVFTFGMIESTKTGAEFRAGADATNSGITAINIEVGGEDMSGTFAGRFLDYTSNGTTSKVNIEKVGTGTWTWVNAPGNTLTTGTLTVSGGKFQIGDGGENKNGHVQGFTYSANDPIPTAVMPIVVNEDGILAFNRQSGEDFAEPTSVKVFAYQDMTFNGGTLLQENSADVVLGPVKGTEMVIDAAEDATGQVIFQKLEDYDPEVSVQKITIKGGTVVTKNDMTDATAIDVNGGTFSVGNSSQAASLDAVVNLNEGGTLVSGNANSIANSVVFNGGTVAGGTHLTIGDLEIKDGSSTLVQMDYGVRTYITGDVTGSGTVVLDGLGSGGRQLWFQGDASDFTGTVESKGGAFVGLYNDKSGSAGAKYVGNGGNFFLASNAADDSGVFQLGELSGNGILRTGNDNQKREVTIQVGGANTDAEYSGSIQNYTHGATDVVGVTKVGTGTWTLSGANTYTGPTTVEEGVLYVKGSLAATPTTVNNGAGLLLTGTMAGNVLFDSGSKFIIDLTNSEMFDKLFNEKNPANGDLMSGTPDLKLIVTEEIMQEMGADDESVVLKVLDYTIENTDLIVQNLDLTQAAGVWGLSTRPDGLYLNGTLSPSPGSDVPEPATWLLLAVGAGLMCFAGRRAKKQA